METKIFLIEKIKINFLFDSAATRLLANSNTVKKLRMIRISLLLKKLKIWEFFVKTSGECALHVSKEGNLMSINFIIVKKGENFLNIKDWNRVKKISGS